MKEVIMPKFGFTQEEGEILEWIVKEGDRVEQGDPLALVSTDKVSMEVEAPESGIVAGIQYKQGDIVPVTKIIAYLLKPGESLSSISASGPGAFPAPGTNQSASAPAQVIPPNPVGVPAVVLTPVAARMVKDLGISPVSIQGSGPGGRITREDIERYSAKTNLLAGDRVNATPAARRVAQENKVELNHLIGSGPEGRLQEADVVAFLETRPASNPVPVNPAPVAPAKTIRTIPFTGMRKTIALNMARSSQTIPAIQLEIDVDMEAALALHARAKKRAGDKKVSLTALIVKVVAWALSRNPMLNSQLGENEILLLPDINVGVAVAIENGLIVPVIQHADQKGILKLAEEINEVSDRARQNRLRGADLDGATFTISNLGMYGIDRFTAIINPPQVGILAVSAVKKQFVANESGEPVFHSIMNMRLSTDHRVVDGAEAARFLADLRKGMECPEEIIL